MHSGFFSFLTDGNLISGSLKDSQAIMSNDLTYFTFQNIRDGPETKFGSKY